MDTTDNSNFIQEGGIVVPQAPTEQQPATSEPFDKKMFMIPFVGFLIVGLMYKNKMLGVGIAICAQILCYAITVRSFKSASDNPETKKGGADIIFSGISIMVIAVYIILLIAMSTFAGISRLNFGSSTASDE